MAKIKKKLMLSFFQRYRDDKSFRLFCVKLPQIVKSFKESKLIFFDIKNNELLKIYIEIWDKLRNIIEKAFVNQALFDKNMFENYTKVLKR